MSNTKSKPDLHLIFPCSDLAVRATLLNLSQKLADYDLSQEEIGSVELVLAEVMNNIVEHAYKDVQNGIIDLKIAMEKNGLNFTVSDTGHPMPKGEIPMGNRALLDCELDALPEGGFGWFLIRDLARELRYQRRGNKNELTFRISVGFPEILDG